MKLILGILFGLGAGYGLTNAFAKRAQNKSAPVVVQEPPPPREPVRP